MTKSLWLFVLLLSQQIVTSIKFSPINYNSDDFITFGGISVPNIWYIVTEYGAKGDGNSIDTKGIQSAINATVETNGGIVYLPSGRYLCGALNLTSNIIFYIDVSAVLVAANSSEFPLVPPFPSYGGPQMYAPLLGAYNQSNLIIFSGAIDGQGSNWWPKLRSDSSTRDFYSDNASYTLPRLIQIVSCTDVHVTALNIMNSPSWAVHVIDSEAISIVQLNITAPATASGTDGIVIDSAYNVTVDQCSVSCGGTHVTVQSGTLPTANSSSLISVTNLILGNGFGVGVGPANGGGISNVVFSRLNFDGSANAVIVSATTGLGVISDIHFSNVTLTEIISTAILVTVDKSPDSGPSPIIQRVSISNVGSSKFGAYEAGNFKCLPDALCSEISLNNIDVWSLFGFYCEYASGNSSNVHPNSCI